MAYVFDWRLRILDITRTCRELEMMLAFAILRKSGILPIIGEIGALINCLFKAVAVFSVLREHGSTGTAPRSRSTENTATTSFKAKNWGWFGKCVLKTW